MFGDVLQPTHLLFILVVALLVLGPKRLPEVGRSLGKGLRDFRGAMSGIEDHASSLFDDNSDQTPAPGTTTASAAVTTTTIDAPPPFETSTPVSTATQTVSPTPVAPAAMTERRVASVAHEPDPSEYSD